TKKFREKLNHPIYGLSNNQLKKVKEISPNELEGLLKPSLTNTYTRITLANKAKTERCTIDINLSYNRINSPNKEVVIDDIAIIEVKQSRASLLGGIISSLRKMQIYPTSFSK